ncbi:MAG: SRPBCC family protein [Gemmatimonadota bacterium]
MARPASRIGAALAGAALMYALDPDRGRRRRAALRDKLAHLSNSLDDAADTAGRDLRNRARGTAAQLRSRVRRDRAGPAVLAERIRARLGRVVSHPGSLEVAVRDDRAVLSGPVFADEAEAALGAAAEVRGIRRVVDRMDRHDTEDRIPGLQGGRRPRLGRRPEFLQEYWAPSARLVGGAAGGALLLAALRARAPARYLLGAAGAGLIARATTNLDAARLTGIRAGRRAIEVQKSINIDAPVDRVFDLWSRPDTFPCFMEHIEEVRPIDQGRSHWVAVGPAGIRVSWDAEITERVPDERIAWRSLPGSTVGTAGWIRFQPNERGGTRVDVHLVYNPPGGAVGHAIARFFGADPKRAMDADLVRLKGLLEGGKTSVAGREVRMHELVRMPSTGDGRVG